jgi:beta-lactamase class A
LDGDLRVAAPEVSFLAAKLSPEGRCDAIHTVDPSTPRPLGSVFKLYVLVALANKIAERRVSWNQPVTIQNRLKSTSGGALQDLPGGSKVPVTQVASDMIALSDNTAADLLIALPGRPAVEDQVERLSNHASLNVPFLTTREFFVLKYARYPSLANHYIELEPAQRYEYLAHTIDRTPLPQVPANNMAEPRDIDTIGWFGSTEDVCRVLSYLASLSSKPGLAPIGSVLDANDGGLDLGSNWSTVWFKGGSENGVLSLAYLARTNKDQTFVVSILTENPHGQVEATGNDLVALARGAFNLLSR